MGFGLAGGTPPQHGPHIMRPRHPPLAHRGVYALGHDADLPFLPRPPPCMHPEGPPATRACLFSFVCVCAVCRCAGVCSCVCGACVPSRTLQDVPLRTVVLTPSGTTRILPSSTPESTNVRFCHSLGTHTSCIALHLPGRGGAGMCGPRSEGSGLARLDIAARAIGDAALFANGTRNDQPRDTIRMHHHNPVGLKHRTPPRHRPPTWAPRMGLGPPHTPAPPHAPPHISTPWRPQQPPHQPRPHLGTKNCGILSVSNMVRAMA